MSGEPISQQALDQARRKLSRRIAAAIASAMAGTDTSFDQIALRLGRPERVVRGWFLTLLSGNGSSIEHPALLLGAMGCELQISAVRPAEADGDDEGAST